MSELKTKATQSSVEGFINSVENSIRQADAFRLLEIFKDETGQKAVMWGPSIIGFGNFKYKYPSGKELDWFPVGFSPRKQALTIYIMLETIHLEPFLAKLGNHKKSKGCIYIKKLADIDEAILREMIRTSLNFIQTKNL